MTRRTPRQAASADNAGTTSSRRRIEISKIPGQPILTRLQGKWGYLCAAIGSVITFLLLFKPWMIGIGPDGNVYATPFGRLTVTSHLSSLWSGAPPKSAHINGTWAVLTAAGAAVTILAFLVLVFGDRERYDLRLFSKVAACAAVTTAFFAVVTMVHMNNIETDLRNMLSSGDPRDLGTQVGMFIRWASGNSSTFPIPGLRKVSYTTSGLTSSAWSAGAASLTSAMAASYQWFRERTPK